MSKKLIALIVTCGILLGGGAAAQAQDPPPQPPAAAPGNSTPQDGRTVPIATVLTSMTRGSGITVVADRSIMGEQVPMPSVQVTAENLEDSIATLVKSLPSGTVWAKLYLPLPRGGRFDGDAVADYALAQVKLYGNIGGTTSPGTIEVMGQKVSPDRAEAVITALNLKPVYILVNPARRGASADAAPASNWNAMTPEQRQQYAQTEAQRLMSMDPNSRLQYFDQQRTIMMQMMQMMSPEQRAQMLQGLGVQGGGPGGRNQGGRNPGGGRRP